MDAARYFEEMHLAMSSQKPEYRLVLSVKVQDLGGADAYLELRQEPVSGKARVFYSTMGRQKLNFQLIRKGVAELPQRLRRADGALPCHRRGSAGPDGFLCLHPGRRPRQPPDGAHPLCTGPYCRWLWDGRSLLPSGKGRSSRWSGSQAVPPIGAIGAPAPQSSSTSRPSSAGWATILPGPSAAPSRAAPRPCSLPLRGRPRSSLHCPSRPSVLSLRRRPSPSAVHPPSRIQRWQSILAVLATV